MPDDELTGDRVTDGQGRSDVQVTDVRVTDVRVTDDRVTNDRVTGDRNPPTLMFCFCFKTVFHLKLTRRSSHSAQSSMLHFWQR